MNETSTTFVARIRTFVPTRRDYAGFGSHWRHDVVAGITVGVVALPLALAFGVTTGLGARAGLVTAIIAGVVAGILGGSNVQVSGPTGAMTIVLVPVVAKFGANSVYIVGLMAGVLIVIAAATGVGRNLVFIPWPVIEGFTVGIASVIFLQQVPTALGVSKAFKGNAAWVAIRAIGSGFSRQSASAVGVVVLVIVVMTVAQRVRKSIPSSLLAVVAATVVAEIFHLKLAQIGALPHSLPVPSFPHVSTSGLGGLFGASIAVAALAAMESLLSARVADGLADSPRHDPDRELFGQGVANLVSPLFGGMPATGAIARTAVNVRAGARTRAAAIVHSLVLVLVVLFASGLVSRIPLCALAGVLMVTAVRMVEPHNVRAVLRATRSDAAVLILTAITTIAFDLIFAVEVGVVAASLLALRGVVRTNSLDAIPLAAAAEVDGEEEAELLHEHIVTYRIDGVLFFGAAHRFLTELTAVSDVHVVILRFPDLQMLDATGAQALGEIVSDLERRKITVLLKGPRPEHVRVMRAVGALDRLASEEHVFPSIEEAIVHAHLHVRRIIHAPAGEQEDASLRRMRSTK